MNHVKIDQEFMLHFMENLINIPSPVGYYVKVSKFMVDSLTQLGYEPWVDNKGNIYVRVAGQNKEKTVGIVAHLDTLGLMVRKINADGSLKIVDIGGINYHSIEGESVVIHTRDNGEYTGVVCCNSHSLHVFKDAATLERTSENMHIMIDEKVSCAEDVQKFGIRVGDHISVNPRFTVTKSGFIKSRFIDDKGGVAAVVATLKALKDHNLVPSNNVVFMFSQYEEVGYGGASVPDGMEELVAVDIASVGPDNAGTEFDVSICTKDAITVYDVPLVDKLVKLAQEHHLGFQTDICTGGGTDASQAVRAGNNLRVAAIGLGTYSSHAMERTHVEAMENTSKLLLAYCCG